MLIKSKAHYGGAARPEQNITRRTKFAVKTDLVETVWVAERCFGHAT